MQKVKKREDISLVEPASGFTRWGGWALVLAGVLWIVTYLAGVLARKLIDPDYFDGSALMWIGMIASEAAQLCLGVGMIALGTRLWTRAKVLAFGGIVLETIALVTLLINLALFPNLLKGAIFPRELSAITTVALFAGMALLGIATLRTRALPSFAALVLLLVGMLTVPLIFLAFPLGSVLPNYLVSDLPLALAAFLLMLIGFVVLRRWRERAFPHV
jgi:hypothetical protein